MSQLRKRGAKKLGSTTPSVAVTGTDVTKEAEQTKVSDSNSVGSKDPESYYYIACAVITILATYVRFDRISFPDKVVFDEVHFGKFASYYLERTYFFDLHPPFAKLLIAFVGYLVGYDGKFKFNNIGDSYITNNVPYVAYRAASAIQGTITVPLMFWTLKTLNFSVAACFLASAIVCFDNAHVIDSRLILLDATLNLTVAMTIFSYVKYSTYRKQAFSRDWWTWLYLTGVSLSLVISTKYVGVFTYLTIGIGVLHELWILLDHKRGLDLNELAYHFFARAWTLIAVPFALYLFWFYLHFAILTKSGPGDSFMSGDFQETLQESADTKSSKEVHYFDQLTLTHLNTDCFFHSHNHQYPLRYEDGRISSNQQQVTCEYKETNAEKEVATNDANNWWEIVPGTVTGTSEFVEVFTEDVVRFRHVGTGGYLLAHDVASPLKATHEEFTIVYDEVAATRFNETLFKLKYTDATQSNKNKRTMIKTHSTQFKVIHVDTVVAMWSHDDEHLPEWGFKHQEVCGNKKVQDNDNSWSFKTIVNLKPEDPRSKYTPKKVTPQPFLKKWWELQFLMFHHNNILTSEHPFASQPDSWPLTLSGVSFWNDNDSKRQIFFIGNVVGFWLEVALIAIYGGIILADQISRRRAVYVLTDKARSRLYNTCGFLFAGWAAHYLPFFLMGRQKFLHHYLPAHLIAALFAGALTDFLCSHNTFGPARPQINAIKLKVFVGVSVAAIAVFFYYFQAITYGDISLTPEQVRSRQWLDIKLHYAK